MKTVVIVPCYNEEKRLDFKAFLDFAQKHSDIHFLFVNDGSRDATLALLATHCQKLSAQMSYLDLKKNGGKAAAVRRGVVEAINQKKYDFFGYWDADLGTPLSEIPQFLARFTNQSVIAVLGSRVQILGKDIQRKMSRHYLGRIFATFASILLKIPVYDTQCGAKMFRNLPATSAAFAEPFRSRWIFDVEIIARLQQSMYPDDVSRIRYDLEEKAVDKWRDVQGSKVKVRDFFQAFFELVGLYFVYGTKRK